MKLRTLLEIQKTVEERATPHDVLGCLLYTSDAADE